MPAYIVAICEVTNPNDNFKKYSAESARLSAQHGGKYTIRGKSEHVKDGEYLTGKALVITEFETMDALLGFYNDPEYQNEIKPLREGTGEYHIAFYESPPSDQQ